MTKKNFVITTLTTGVVSLSIFLAGCSSAPVANAPNTNQAVVNSNTAIVNTPANITPPAPNTSAMNSNNNSAPNANSKPTAAMKEPTPQIGSGGGDLALFLQSRAALGFDKQLQGDVIIEVKEGNVTLSGKAANAEQKAKAEQAIKAVNGVKTVTNKIAVAK